MKVTIIEDEAAHLELMERAITKEFPDAQIDCFGEIEHCLDSIDRIDPDLIITDYLLPGMNGLNLLEELKRRDKDIPVVMVTGQGDENIAVKAMKLGAYDYIVKSGDFFSLVPSIIKNVILRKELKRALQESQALYEQERNKLNSILASMVTPLAVISADMTINFANPVFERTFGKKLLGKPCQAIFGKSCDVNTPYRKAIKDRQTQNREIEDINGRIWHVTISPGIEDKGDMVTAVLVFQDITERKQAEEELRKVYEELADKNKELSKLSKKLLFLQEWDRQQLSMELHDQIGQTLTIIKMDIEHAGDSISSVYPVLKEKMKALERSLGQAIREVKDICHRLRPSTLDNIGLVPSLKALIDEVKGRCDLQIEFYANNILQRLNPDIEIALYRIVQESLTNVMKYANAKSVFINLILRGDLISLSIEDDGIGFKLDEILKSKSKGLGLLIMKERVEQLRGIFNVESNPERGTHLLTEIPFVA